MVKYIAFREGYEQSLPEGLRISEGPRMSEREVPWAPGVHFYLVEDLDTSECSYCTSVETSTKCGKSLKSFRRSYNRIVRNHGAGNVIMKDRYLISRVPKYTFIKESGRKFDLVREYFYRW